MHRTLFFIPVPFTDLAIPVHSYGFMMAVGFFVTLYVAKQKAKKEGIEPNIVGDLAIYVLGAGLIGARIFYVVQNIGEYKGNFLDVFKVYQGGLVYYGGLITAFVTLIVFAKIKKVNLFSLMDVAIMSAVLGLAFGRIGCFLNGCCYGDVVDSGLFCAVKFPKTVDESGYVDGSPVFLHHYEQGLVKLSDSSSLPVHPTQIYAFCACILIFFILNALWKYRKNRGEILLFFGIIYSLYRFCIEFVRDDNPALFDSLTISQNISIIIFFISLIFLVRGRLKLRVKS